MRYCLVFILFLAACDMGGPGFRGIEPVRVVVDGSQFSVRQNEGRVEVLRLNSEMALGRRSMAVKMASAIEQATGCMLVQGSLQGDQVQATGRLKCSGKKVSAPRIQKQTLDCEAPDAAIRDGVAVIVTELDCF